MKTYWAVNWKDGMKVESSQFEQERTYTNDKIRLANAINLTDYNFGLFNDEANTYFQYEINGSQLRINYCKAITRFGWMININDENASSLPGVSLEQLVKEYDEGDVIQLYIRIHPTESFGFGDIDEQEFPYRLPEASVKYDLEFMNLNNALPVDHLITSLPVLQIRRVINGYEIVSKYIPPCCTLNAFKELKGWHHELNNFNFEWAKLNSSTAQELMMKGEQSFITNNIQQLTSKLATFIADVLDDFTYNNINRSPLETFLFYKKIGRLFSAVLGNMDNKREMVQLFADKTNHSIENFLASLNKLNGLEYNHLNIREVKDTIDEYTKMMIILFRRLNEDF